jgi:hypothetical protein
MRQATNLKDLELPKLLPGIKISTNPTNYRPMRALQSDRMARPGYALAMGIVTLIRLRRRGGLLDSAARTSFHDRACLRQSLNVSNRVAR